MDALIKNMHGTKEHLYAMEAVTSPQEQGRVRSIIRLYQDIDGFSANSFFTVNHGLVTAIMGYLATYLIVLVQFKLADVARG